MRTELRKNTSISGFVSTLLTFVSRSSEEKDEKLVLENVEETVVISIATSCSEL